MTCFAAGMLMTLSIVHILPEAAGIYKAFQIEELAKVKKGGRLLEEEDHGPEVDDFPMPNLIFFCGFMTMMFLDQVAFKSKGL